MDYIVAQGARKILIALFIMLAVIMGSSMIDKKNCDIVDRATIEFMEDVKLNGYISESLLDSYLKRLSFKPVKVVIHHTNKNKRVKITSEIMKAVYDSPERVYFMKEGDYVFIMVQGRAYGQESIMSRHGGHIEHEGY